MNLVTPELGLIFWQLLVFLVVFLVLRSKAWKPIIAGLKAREEGIDKALQAAKDAESRMQELNNQNEQLLAQARKERDGILKDARDAAQKLVDEARGEARKKADEDLLKARAEIATEKAAAMAEIKNLVAELSISVTEKVLRAKLDNPTAQNQLVNHYLTDLKVGSN